MTIRINSTTGLNRVILGGPKRAGGDFTLSGAQGSGHAAPAKTSAMAGLMGMDALIALQGEEDALTGRRRRQIKRSHSMLDMLDKVKVAMLGGENDQNSLLKLRALISEQRENVDDQDLQDLLDHIETRAAVELAKRKLM